jgi:multidrug transporter EmrE-like cation transporter
MTLVVLFWLLLAMTFYSVGDYYAKVYANTHMLKYGILAFVTYCTNTLCFLLAISKFNSLSVLGTIWNVAYVVVTLFIGVAIFKEPLTTLQLIGVGFGVVSVVLLSL